MAGITGQGTTFNLPNFVGELFNISTEDTPFMSAIGGLTGGKSVNAKRWEWQYYDLRASATDRAALEGADAPNAEARVRANAYNVVQIVHEAIEVSYTKLAATQHLDAASIVGGATNPVTNEFDWQLTQALKQIARDLNDTFINGTFAEPADNLTPRYTRGMLEAVASNVIAGITAVDVGGDVTGVAATDVVTTASAHGLAVADTFKFTTLNGGTGAAINTLYFVKTVPSTTTFTFSAVRGGPTFNFTANITTGSRIAVNPKVTYEDIGNAMQLAYDNGGLMIGETRVALVNPLQKRRLTKALVTDAGYVEQTRNVGGVNLSVIETDFGALSIMVDRYMPADQIALLSLEEFAPVFLQIPGKGFLFVEPLAKTGSADSSQIYGEVGLEYGNERKHAKITGLG